MGMGGFKYIYKWLLFSVLPIFNPLLDAWIFTDGLNTGVCKQIGEMCNSYASYGDQDKFAVIGFCPWKTLQDGQTWKT